MRIAVLAKQVPRFEELTMGEDGRIRRADSEPELNPYCRRAVAKGAELARATGGECVVFTLGPPSAGDVLREAIAWGASRGVHLCDEAFAGSDTLATARALAAALRAEGPFDLVLAGRNSVDAETAQVGPQVAQLLGLPLLAGVRELDLTAESIKATCERDDGYTVSITRMPAVITTAERLCDPAKVPPEGRASVSSELITVRAAHDLGPGPWGTAGSPTTVGELRSHTVDRAQVVLTGSLPEQVAAAAVRLRAVHVPPPVPAEAADTVASTPGTTGGRTVAVVLEPGRDLVARELLGAAARIAREIHGDVTALTSEPIAQERLSSWGADRCVLMSGSTVEQDVATALGSWCERVGPWAVLAPATASGCEIASRVAAALGLGLTGDAVALSIEDYRLVAWKPAFAGHVLAAITSRSDIQLCTVRPGILALPSPRSAADCPVETLAVQRDSPTEHLELVRDDDVEDLARAEIVIAVGAGVTPGHYDVVEGLRAVLGAEVAATRKVTDKGWLPRARQLGITGRSIAPRVVVSVGASGKFNHMVGVRQAGFVLAVNSDPDAPVFGCADLGIVGDHTVVLPLLTAALTETGPS